MNEGMSFITEVKKKHTAITDTTNITTIKNIHIIAKTTVIIRIVATINTKDIIPTISSNVFG